MVRNTPLKAQSKIHEFIQIYCTEYSNTKPHRMDMEDNLINNIGRWCAFGLNIWILLRLIWENEFIQSSHRLVFEMLPDQSKIFGFSCSKNFISMIIRIEESGMRFQRIPFSHRIFCDKHAHIMVGGFQALQFRPWGQIHTLHVCSSY